MIYTVTLNPSLDYTVWTRNFSAGRINRTDEEKIYPGGKGINVSVVLKNLGFDSLALGFCAGFTGAEIKRLLAERGCSEEFIDIPGGTSRINVKLKSDTETEINARGPKIPASAVDALFSKIEKISDGDILILAGSIPAGLPEDLYMLILERIREKNVRTVVDASGELLLSALKYRPFLIKPNLDELREVCGCDVTSKEEIVSAAKELQMRGACNVLVSLAGDGAILVCENGEVLSALPPAGKVINSVGAGDSMVAGFIAGFLSGGSYSEAFNLALCAGSASAFNEWLAEKEDILKLLE